MVSASGVFPVESCLIALLTSSSLGGSVFVSTYGRRAIASALISAGMLRTAPVQNGRFVSDKRCPIHIEQ